MVNTAGMVFNQTKKYVNLGGKIFQGGNIEEKVNYRVQQAGGGCFRYDSQAMYDREDAPLNVKVQCSEPKQWRPLLYGC